MQIASDESDHEQKSGGVWWTTEDAVGPIVKCGWDDVRGLTKHWDRMTPEWRASVTEACEAIRDKLQSIQVSDDPEQPSDSATPFSAVDLSELKDLAATVNTNSHGLGAVGGKNTDVALGLFPALSMFNHSCDPNCCFSGTGTVSESTK